jgi:hypothetical protein
MTKNFLCFSLLIIFLSIANCNAQQITLDNAFQLAFVDSFSGSNYLDTNKWSQKWQWNVSDSVAYTTTDTVDIGYRKWYKPTIPPLTVPADYPYDTTNFKTSGGILSLYQRKENYSGNCWEWPSCGNSSVCNVPPGTCDPNTNTCWHSGYKQFQYTTGMLLSKYRYKYGFYEIKFKLPASVTAPYKYSAGPNFWLWQSGDTVNYSEIDIFEINGRNNIYTCNAHYRRYPQTAEADKKSYFFTDSTGISGNVWHYAGCLWTGTQVAYYLDGSVIAVMDHPQIREDSLIPMQMIIDINAPVHHLGEIFDPTYSVDYQYQIDYVKVWQLSEDCSTDKSYCSAFNPATYVSRLYKSITIGGSGCTDAVTNTANLGLYATDYVLLDEGFSIDGNSTVTIDLQGCDGTTIYQPGISPQPAPSSFLERHR